MMVNCDPLGQKTVPIEFGKPVALTQLKYTVLLLAVKITDPVVNYGLGVGYRLHFSINGARFWYEGQLSVSFDG